MLWWRCATTSLAELLLAEVFTRQPAPFGSESHEDDLSRWQDFNVSCKAWLFYGNKSYELDHRVEVTHAETPIANVDGEPQDVKDRCNQLYSILTGLLKGKPLHLLRQVGNRNGLRRQWCQLYMPRTRSCAIYLVSVPSFTTRDRTLLEQVLGLERMRAEYVRSSGTDIPDHIMLSVLVRFLPKAIQQHVQLNDSSTYHQVRAMVVSYERTTTSWSPGKIHSELGIFAPKFKSESHPTCK